MTEVRPNHTLKSRNSWKAVRSLLRKLRSNSLSNQNKSVKVFNGLPKGSPLGSEKSVNLSVAEIPEPQKDVQKALVVARKGEYEIRHDFPMPTVGEDEIMIRTQYVGLNPIDWKSVDFNFCLPQFPWVSHFPQFSNPLGQRDGAMLTLY
jgi:hypothetical protein